MQTEAREREGGWRFAALRRALFAIAVAAGLLAPAAGAMPLHPFLPEASLEGFNHACGTAVDSQGDVYVSNSGASKIEVFDSSGSLLTSIANSHGPCGLAVDSTGRLYVSQTQAGEVKVVRYTPSVFPVTAATTYGAPTTFDPSPEARGVAVDTSDDSVYVADKTRVTIYKSDGSLFTGNEVQALKISGSTSGGSYTLSFEGQETSPLAYNASEAEIRAALEGLPTIGAGNVTMPDTSDITFVGALAGINVSQIVVNGASLVGGTAVVETKVEGFDGHLGAGEFTDATGIAVYTNRLSGPATQGRYVAVADAGADRITLFGGRFGVGAEPFLPGSLEVRSVVDGSETPAGALGLAATGAYLAADSETGHLYAFDAAHGLVNEFESNGHFLTQISHGFSDAQPTAIAVKPQWDETQQLVFDASGGTFKLAFEGQETVELPFGAPPYKPGEAIDSVQEALEHLPNIGSGNVSVIETEVGNPVYRIAFVGALGKRDVAQLTVNASGLTGDLPAVPGTGPAAAVTTSRAGSGPGRVYVSSGASPGSSVFAFGPLPDPSRAPLPKPRSFEFEGACGTVVDNHGDLYVAGSAGIKVYAPEPTAFDAKGNPKPLATIPNFDSPCFLAVDSEGNLYAAESGSSGHRFSLYQPSAYPPVSGTTYSGPSVLGTFNVNGLAVNPANDHLFVASFFASKIVEYDSAKNGSVVLNPEFGEALRVINAPGGIDVYGANGDVYVTAEGLVRIVDPTGTKVLATVDGSGSPRGPFRISGGGGSLAVDQSNGHFFLTGAERGAVEEFEPTGAFVGEAGSGSFPISSGVAADVAVDNSGGPHDGDIYHAQLKTLSAFGPLTYGEAPIAVTGSPGEVGGGAVTMNATVDPRGVAVEECRFDYTTEADFEANGFTGPGDEEAACVPGASELGTGSGAVAVRASISGLDPEQHYCYRVRARNKFGSSAGEAVCFGPPAAVTEPAQPVLYREATVRGSVDPSGLPTAFHFEYLTGAGYERNLEEGRPAFEGAQSTASETLAADSGPTEVEAALAGLAEGVEYRFRLLASNSAASVEGGVRTFTTLAQHPALSCPNETLRLENSSRGLPDCRAYELVTPADTHGASPSPESSNFGDWLVTPSGPLAGDSLAYFFVSSLPGTEGNGLRDAFRATRGAAGWESTLFSPSSVQSGSAGGASHGISSDQLYAIFRINGGTQPHTLAAGYNLRTPAGFELLGQGSLGTDPEAYGDYISPGGGHSIFSTGIAQTAVQLEPDAPPAPTGAVYDRAAGGATRVVSLPPAGATPAELDEFQHESAIFRGATPDGATVVFAVKGKLYLRRAGGETVRVADAPASYAGISSDGSKVFYAATTNNFSPAGLYLFDAETEATTLIAPASEFVNVSADGSRVYFTSKADLDGPGAGQAEAHNLYLWAGADPVFVAQLEPGDLGPNGGGFPETGLAVALNAWTASCLNGAGPGSPPELGRCPSRTTPDGGILVFQSHADLTPYQANGHSEIYRYDARQGGLACVSCDPTGLPAEADSDFESFRVNATGVSPTNIVPALTAGGERVVFETKSALLPDDANSVLDVYEWQADGAGGCNRSAGCLALISSGQADTPSYVYSMTADGHDVYFTTQQKLIGSDVAGSPSIYDARVGGGFPQPVAAEPCQGDACQGEGTPPPIRSGIRSDVPSEGNAAPRRPCPAGTHRVRRHGRKVCVKHRHHRKKHPRRRAGGNRRSSR